MRPSYSILCSGLFVLLTVLPVSGQDVLPVPDRDADVAGTGEPELMIKVFEFQHADAKEINRLFEKLFPSNGGPARRLPSIRFSVNEKSNAVAVAGTAAELQVIEDLATRLDVIPNHAAADAPKSVVYRLRNVAAQDAADSINQWLSERKRLFGLDQAEAGPRTDGKPECAVVAEVVSNSLVVSSSLNAKQQAELEKVIRALDQRPKMVKVKVVLKKTENGVETVLSRPQILTFESQTGSVTVGSESESYTIELTPSLILDDEPMDVLGNPAAPDRR